jgi:hypothetical protein
VPVEPVDPVAVVPAVLVTVDWGVAVDGSVLLSVLNLLAPLAQQLLRPLEQRKVPQSHPQLHRNQR